MDQGKNQWEKESDNAGSGANPCSSRWLARIPRLPYHRMGCKPFVYKHFLRFWLEKLKSSNLMPKTLCRTSISARGAPKNSSTGKPLFHKCFRTGKLRFGKNGPLDPPGFNESEKKLMRKRIRQCRDRHILFSKGLVLMINGWEKALMQIPPTLFLQKGRVLTMIKKVFCYTL